jgi:lipopolysaccharide export system permease protein
MGGLNRYILKNAAISIGGLIVFACCVLLLERLLRIFEIVTNSTNPGGDATTMIVNLLPYYLGMAVPIALLLGTTITIDRLSKSSELTAAFGSGFSLFHMTKPFILLAIFLSGITVFVEGYLQPVGRYKYRQTLNTVKQQSFTAALREGKFTKVDRVTFFAGTKGKNGGIGPIFIYETMDEEAGEKGYRLTTAELGEIKVLEGHPILNLTHAQGFPVSNNKVAGQVTASRSAITRPAEVTPYRARGDDEREMTSGELFENRNGDQTETIDQNTNNAMLHLRLSKSVLLLLLPFIAVPFGLTQPLLCRYFCRCCLSCLFTKSLGVCAILGRGGENSALVGHMGHHACRRYICLRSILEKRL